MDAKHLLEKLKLTTVIDLNDMYLIDVSGTIQKYDSPLEGKFWSAVSQSVNDLLLLHHVLIQCALYSYPSIL